VIHSLLKLALIALAVFAMLEATARLALFGGAGLDPRRVPLTRGLEPKGMLRDSPIRAIGKEYEPNLDVFARLVRFETNSRGLRDEEYSIDKPERTFRVAVLGSSYTAALGAESEDSFHSVLERRFSAEFAPTSYEFINFAVQAAMPQQMVAMLIRRALDYDPDLILFAATRTAMREIPRAWNWRPARRFRFGQHPRWPMIRFVEREGPRSYFMLLSRRALQTRAEVAPKKTPELAPIHRKSVIWKLGRISDETGIPIVIVRLDHFAGEPSPAAPMVAESARAHGLFFVNTQPEFDGMELGELAVHGLDLHPNAEAHAIFADVVGAFLRREGLLGQ
jgi:hypothetical protein